MSKPQPGLASPPVRIDGPTMLGLGLWFGLATGIAEVVLLLFQRFVFGRPLEVGPQLVWMIPLGDALLFAVPATGLALLAWRTPASALPRLGLTVLAFFTSFSLLLFAYYHIATLHVAALLLLAAGLAFQTGRVLATRLPGLLRVVRVTVVPMIVAVILSGVGVNLWLRTVERRAHEALPPATAGTPNVLLIILDTVRAMSMSLYGHTRPTTPNLLEYAKRGVVFERPIATAPWTLTSHASMFTGRYPFEMSADWDEPLDGTYPTLAEYLGGLGYETAAFVANLRYCSKETGLGRGFIHYEDYPVSLGQMYLSTSLGGSRWGRGVFGRDRMLNRKDAAAINRDFLSWLSRHGTRPFFAFLNYYDAHEPYAPEAPYDLMFASREPRRRHIDYGRRHSPDEVEELRDAYEGALAYVDHELGRLLEELDRRGVLENTIVIITSDHGEEFAEHDVMNHGNSLYMPGLHVPLLVSFPPRVPSGQRMTEPVSLRDIPATVVDLLGTPGESIFPGHSLARYWDGTENPPTPPLLAEVSFAKGWPDWYPVSVGDMKSVIFGRYHYVVNGDGREELYDLVADPLEQTDLAPLPEHHAALERARESLRALLEPGLEAVPTASARPVRRTASVE